MKSSKRVKDSNWGSTTQKRLRKSRMNQWNQLYIPYRESKLTTILR